jgi:transcriptional regulator with XRE-family HTH domain
MNNRADSDEARANRKKAGTYIKSLRSAHEGMTQAKLAQKLGYEWPTFVAQIESGFGRVPSEAMEDWAKALDVNAGDFAWNLLRFYDPYLYKLLSQHRGKRG